jgi:hypothetical protein
MTFKEFLNMEGQYGSVKANNGPLQLIKTMAKLAKPVTNKGTSVSRMFHAGGGVGPARPAKITSVSGPLTSPTFLK